jgi:hypothetical protein
MRKLRVTDKPAGGVDILRHIFTLRRQPALRWTPAGIEARLGGEWVRLARAREVIREAGVFGELAERGIPYGWLLVPDPRRTGAGAEGLGSAVWKWAGRRNLDGAARDPTPTPR